MTRAGCLTVTGSSLALWGLIIASALALSGCQREGLSRENAGADGRTVELMAEAPDGTKLWRFDAGSRYVYFASTGAEWREHCGKNCNRTVEVPTATDPLEASTRADSR